MATPMKAVPASLAALTLSACVAQSGGITDRSAMNASSTGRAGSGNRDSAHGTGIRRGMGWRDQGRKGHCGDDRTGESGRHREGQ